MITVEISKLVELGKDEKVFIPMLTIHSAFGIGKDGEEVETDENVAIDFVPAKVQQIVIDDQIMFLLIPKDEQTLLAPKVLPPEVIVLLETDGVDDIGGSSSARLEEFGDDCGEVTFTIQIKDELEKILKKRDPLLVNKKGFSLTKEEMERDQACLISIR
uniref:Uncharacterized protein n=1 Tax=Myoviridae sp. ctaOv25 TaxID=2827290 RepID=A0A8S5R5Z9_9CAUD|nr:MAG TPA: hypothetical protein [Myoviridae sp. ctaOv25]